MAKQALQNARVEKAPTWQQRNVRAGILDAARRVAARDGIAELTLGRVADEAGFSTNTVFAYFLNKNELMVAIVADDLAKLARKMRDVFPANEYAAPEPEEVEEKKVEAAAPAEVRSEYTAPVVEAAPEEAPQPAVVEEPARDFVPTVEPHDDASAAAELPVVAEDVKPVDEPQHAVEHSPTVEHVDEFPVVSETVDHAPPEPVVEDPYVAPVTETPAVHEEPVEAVAEIHETDPAEELHQPQDTVSGVPAVEEERHEEYSTSFDTTHTDEPSYSHTPLSEEHHSPEFAGDPADVIARLQESVAKLESRPVDAWLERRLRELERMITSLEERQATTERNSSTAAGFAEENARDWHSGLDALEKSHQAAFEQTSKSFTDKVDSAEKRLKQMLQDLRNLATESSSRIDVLERAAYNAALKPVDETTFTGSFTSAPVPEEEPAPEPAQDESATPAEAEKPAASKDASYLSQARRSAMAAAAQSVAEPTDSFQRFASTVSSMKTGARKSRYFIAVGAGLLIVLLGSAFVLKQHIGVAGPVPQQDTRPVVAAHQSAHPKKALSVLSPQVRLAALAARGNASAELLLGLEYLDGKSAAKNEGEGAQLIARSAASGSAVAQFWLGTLYANGRGLKADPAQAMHWYAQSAAQGNRKAMHQLAVSYAEGWGSDKNYQEAANWFAHAASLGYVDSAFNLGVLYERGLGVTQSLVDAYKWYSIAAALGDKDSAERISVLKTQMTPADVAAATQAASAFTPDVMDPAANTPPLLDSLPKS